MRPARAVRGLWPDHNPLRRAVDRAKAVIVAGLAVAFLAAAPLVAVAAWHAAYSMGSRTAAAQQAAWHQIPAVPVTTVQASGYGRYEATVRARWTAPDGTATPARSRCRGGPPPTARCRCGSMRQAAGPARRSGWRRYGIRRSWRPSSLP